MEVLALAAGLAAPGAEAAAQLKAEARLVPKASEVINVFYGAGGDEDVRAIDIKVLPNVAVKEAKLPSGGAHYVHRRLRLGVSVLVLLRLLPLLVERLGLFLRPLLARRLRLWGISLSIEGLTRLGLVRGAE